MPASTTAGSRESAREGLRVRLGQVRFNGERTCWLFGRRQEDFEAVADLVTAIVARYPRLALLFTAPQPSTRASLPHGYPHAVVLPPHPPTRKSGGLGQGVSGRLDPGGRRTLQS